MGRNVFSLRDSLSWFTQRGRPSRRSNSSSSTPAPRWDTVVSKPKRTKWPLWDLSKRTQPRQRQLPNLYSSEHVVLRKYRIYHEKKKFFKKKKKKKKKKK